MPGRIIPPENKVTEFMDAVDEFLKKEESLIGIHCTHGLNRTGYMVCRYMRDRLGVPAKDAIKKFEKARGYQIERQNYIADLLGTEPPKPDLGCDTYIKPVSNRYSPSTRSPLAIEEERICEDRQRDRFNRQNNRYNNRYGGRQDSSSHARDSRSDRNDSRSNNWRDKRDNESSSHWRNRDSNRSYKNKEASKTSSRSRSKSSDSNYDFRRDY
ncbi:uncharacterized protein LOC142976176 isoform X2 [Anticarsia gemmatalis]